MASFEVRKDWTSEAIPLESDEVLIIDENTIETQSNSSSADYVSSQDSDIEEIEILEEIEIEIEVTDDEEEFEEPDKKEDTTNISKPNNSDLKGPTFPCNECLLTTDHDSVLKADKPKKPSKRHVCCKCDFTSRTKKNLNEHFKKEHPGQIPEKSGACSPKKSTSKKKRLMDFEEGVNGIFSCDQCSYKSSFPRKVRAHFNKIHTGLLCPDCDFKPDRTCNLKKHLTCKRHPPPPAVPRHSCHLCPFTYTNFTQLEQHLLTEHKFDNLSVFLCSHCKYKAKSFSQLKAHYRLCESLNFFH